MLKVDTLLVDTSPVSVPSQLPYVGIYIFFNCEKIDRFIYEEILDRKKRL